MKIFLSQQHKLVKSEVLEMIAHFAEEGEVLFEGKRNTIKVFPHGQSKINIKSFKAPNIINRFAYSFLRMSKAERSFRYGEILLSKNIPTPAPIAFAEKFHLRLLGHSYYVSEHLDYDFTFRELNNEPNFPHRDKILKEFTRFTFKLHEKNVNFLDHSPGNTLVTKNKTNYKFYLVDLNRMKFQTMDFDQRMKNFSRLTTKPDVIRVMAYEYGRLMGRKGEEVHERMLFFINRFQERRNRKRLIKRKLKDF